MRVVHIFEWNQVENGHLSKWHLVKNNFAMWISLSNNVFVVMDLVGESRWNALNIWRINV